VDVVGAADQRRELAELLGEGEQHLVLVVDGLREEGHELGARALRAQRQRDRRQLFDAVQAQLHVLVAQLVDQHCDWKEAFI